jgi:MFS family permease
MVSFIQAYLLVSIFPYGAYMAVLLWNNNASSSSILQHDSDMDSRRQQQLFQTITAAEGDAQQTTIIRHLSLREKVKSKIPRTITVEDAGPYAALLATSFMIGRTVAALFWGHLADIYGRRMVLLISLIGSGFATLWFGMTTRYGGLGGAVMARGFVGAWNSIVGVSKTLATELAFHDFGDKDLTMHEGGSTDNVDVEHTLLTQQGSKESETSATSNSSSERDDQSSIEQQHQLETRIVGLTMSMRAW